MNNKKRIRRKTHKFALFLLVFLVTVVKLPPLRAAADDKVIQVQGLDDYLNNSTGVNFFAHELNTREADILQAKTMRERLVELTSRMQQWLDAPANILAVRTFYNPAETVTLYSPALPSGFLTVKHGYHLGTIQNKYGKYINVLDNYIAKREKELEGAEAIYRGFAVVGENNRLTDTFVVGDMSTRETLLDDFRVAASSLYSSNEAYRNAIEDEKKPSDIEKMIAEPIGDGAFSFYLWLVNWNVDLTIDGLIFGRMSPSHQGNVDFTHFGLEANNPYGVVAATAYYVLRRILLGILPVAMMFMLFSQLFKGGQRGRARIKELLSNFLMAIILMFVAPYVIDVLITLRDAVLRAVSAGMGTILNALGLGTGIGSSVLGLIYITYERNHTLLNAVIWLASVFAGFFYLVSYIQIAMLAAGAVAILPIILFISVFQPRILRDWWNVFFPNLLVPLVDLILMQLPAVVLLLFKSKLGGQGGSMILGVITIIIIWNGLKIRDRVIKILGFEGFMRGGGGLLAAGAMALRMASMAGRRDRSGKGTERGDYGETISTADAAKLNEQQKELHEEALRGVGSVGRVPGEIGPGYDPHLGNTTDEFLNGLDMAYGLDGANDDFTRETPGGELSTWGETGEMEPLEDVSMENGTEGGSLFSGELGEVPGEAILDPLAASEPLEVLSWEETTDAVHPASVSDLDPVPGQPAAEGARFEEESALGFGQGASGADPLRESAGMTLPETSIPASATDIPLVADPFLSGSTGDFSQPPDIPIFPTRTEGILVSRDDIFASGLKSEAERKRYDNLLHMDGYHQKIQENEAKMRNAGYSRDTYVTERASYVEQANRLNAHMDASRERLSTIANRNTTEWTVEWTRAQEIAAQKTKLAERVRQLDEAASLDRANGAYRAEASRRMQIEQSYAKAQRMGGINDRVYESAMDYVYQHKWNDVQKSVANYKNFDSKRFEGILSPAEKETFYRERVEQEKRERNIQRATAMVRVAGKTALAGAAVGMTAASIYGGERAMADVGLTTWLGASYVGGKAANLGSRVMGAYKNRPVSVSGSTDGGNTTRSSAAGTGRVSEGKPVRSSAGSAKVSDLAKSARNAEVRLSDDVPTRSSRTTGRGNSSPETLGKNAERRNHGDQARSRQDSGRGNSSPETLGKNAENMARRNGTPGGKEEKNK